MIVIACYAGSLDVRRSAAGSWMKELHSASCRLVWLSSSDGAWGDPVLAYD